MQRYEWPAAIAQGYTKTEVPALKVNNHLRIGEARKMRAFSLSCLEQKLQPPYALELEIRRLVVA